MPRLTRKEQQAKTRSKLMAAAAKVFACHGLEKASVDQVAGEAGYTKGAFYANFKSKEELFLAMLDERFAQRLDEIDEVMDSGAPVAEQARAIGEGFTRYLAADPEWCRLFFEFSLYAAKDEDFRQELRTRTRAMRQRIAEGMRAHSEEMGVSVAAPYEEIALMTSAMADGVALLRILEPEDVSDELFGTMLAIFFTGLQTLAREGAPQG